MSTEKIFYYRNSNKQEGPLTESEFIQLIQNEVICAEDEMWIEEMENWLKLKDSIYSYYLRKAELEVTDFKIK